jgi:hypothetical protein
VKIDIMQIYQNRPVIDTLICASFTQLLCGLVVTP